MILFESENGLNMNLKIWPITSNHIQYNITPRFEKGCNTSSHEQLSQEHYDKFMIGSSAHPLPDTCTFHQYPSDNLLGVDTCENKYVNLYQTGATNKRTQQLKTHYYLTYLHYIIGCSKEHH
jgi:hypothetical protein